MDDIVSSLIVVAITGVVVILIFWLVARQKKQREATLKNMASMNGWIYESVNEPSVKGYRLRKGDWLIEGLNEATMTHTENTGSSNVTSMTRWFSKEIRLTDGIILIGPRQPEINLGAMGDFVMNVALQKLLGDEAQNAKGIERVELGSLELMQRYMIWTNQVETAKELLTMNVENALLNWPAKKVPPVIKYSYAGMEIKVQGFRIYDEQELYALIKIGNMLLDAAR